MKTRLSPKTFLAHSSMEYFAAKPYSILFLSGGCRGSRTHHCPWDSSFTGWRLPPSVPGHPLAGEEGFEPSKTGLEPVGLPLAYSPIRLVYQVKVPAGKPSTRCRSFP